MKYLTLKKYYKPKTSAERHALRRTKNNIGSWPECEKCARCVAACQLINNDYEAECWQNAESEDQEE